MKYEEKITTTPHGTAIIKGTNIWVINILRLLEEGKTMNEIINIHPELSTSDISACIEYAVELVIISDYKKSTQKINENFKSRNVLADKILNAAKDGPPKGWTE